ncbi:hypothetical protein [Inconstantimicrobium mannanitabidum]|uniref:Uncharacterized protein n=1 Tax=Inconstantimicrobium mannanitabidum TaxID=1604901 RepID=A0ACB5RHM6_9CLOT|nr:hypothetical protein [Clostridium sp. TW13]GKX68583.1 hypothetical protein rsdtw13_38410 [Clostridium sp. TW13]
MNNKLKLKSKILILMLSIILIIPSQAYASTTIANSPGSTIKSFLNAVKSQNIEQIISLEEDDRLDSSELADWHKKNFNNDREVLSSYSILRQEQLGKDQYKFITKLKMKDGSISQVPFNVKFSNNKWKVIVTANSLEDKDFTVMQKAIISKSSNTINSISSSKLTSWNFSNLNGTMYSINTFDVNNSSSVVTLNLRQWAEYTPPDTSNINYAVVIKHWYGDNEWGSINVIGNNPNSPRQVVIHGKSSSISGANLKFTKNYDDSNNQFGNNGFGEIYNGY